MTEMKSLSESFLTLTNINFFEEISKYLNKKKNTYLDDKEKEA
jgi:hypothetical protein